MSQGRGIAFAMGSVLLVSGAPLGMRWGMSHLPQPDQWLMALGNDTVDGLALGVVMLSIFAYALSMLCWLAGGPAGLAFGPSLFAVEHQLRAGVPAGSQLAVVQRTVQFVQNPGCGIRRAGGHYH